MEEFLRDVWYVAAWTDEVLDNRILARTICGEPLVLLRDAQGRACAVEDRCAHRGLPLSEGTLERGALKCRYHGVEFDVCTGSCIRIPGQQRIPQTARIKRYPIVEKDRAVWIWMGDPDRADPALVPVFDLHGQPGWACRPTHTPMAANHQLVADNLLDLTHVGYVHRATLGGDPEDHAAANLQVERTDNGVRVTRVMRDTIPGPFHVRQGGFKGRVDRWQIIEWRPGIVVIDSGMADVGRGGPFELEPGVFNLRKVVYNGLTPETNRRTHYFWSMVHQTGADKPQYVEAFYREVVATFTEDVEIIEAQQARLDALPQRALFDRVSDAGGLQARRIYQSRLDSERQAGAAPHADRSRHVA